MQGGQRSNGRRPYHGGGSGGGYGGGGRPSGGRGPYDRPQGRPFRDAVTNVPRTRTSKEAMETNVLLSMDQFLSMDDISVANSSNEEQEMAFGAYKERHRRIALERFFLGHKDEAWLMERYLGDEMDNEAKDVKETYEKFVADYEAGAMQDLKLEFEESMLPVAEPTSVKNLPLSAPLPAQIVSAAIERFGDVLTIGNVSPSVKKASLESVPKLSFNHSSTHLYSNQLLRDSSEQFVKLYLGEPVYEKSLYRSGFAVFQDGADLNSLALKLENILVEGSKIYYSVQKSFTRQVKLAAPEFSEPSRMEKDFSQSTLLLNALLSKYDLGQRVWTQEIDQAKALDLNLACLRRVFSICYYTGVRCANALELQKQCGDFCLRSTADSLESDSVSPSSVDQKIGDLICLFGPPFEPATEDNIVESKFVIKLDEARYRCSLCNKLFKGPEFVIKHVRMKHEEESIVALQQLTLLNMFLASPAPCAFLKSHVSRRASHSSQPSNSNSRYEPPRSVANREPPPDADTRHLRRPMKKYVDWDAPATGEVEISYD